MRARLGRALFGAALAATPALACGSVSEQPLGEDCQNIRQQICAEAAKQGAGKNPCPEGGAFFAPACEKLREKCGGVVPTPTCP